MLRKTLTNSCVLSLMTMATFNTAMATDLNGKIVYGEDNRIETIEASEFFQERAHSTAGMFKNVKAAPTGEHYILPPQSLQKELNLCEGEKFAEQPISVICSGFLVGPDLLVTAGHCITKQSDCDTVSWVFDYKVKDASGKTDVMVPKKNVYKCKKLVEANLYQIGDLNVDYSLVRLERVVEGRTPLKYRTEGKIEDRTAITVIGHPTGLPQKVSSGANVLENTKENYFKTNLDTFGGNSGSAVFNDETGVVEGILVRGAEDYINKNGCRAVNKTEQEVTDFRKFGEAVSRITDIRTLKYRDLFLDAVKVGNVELVKEYAGHLAEASIYDNDLHTAIHLAAINSQVTLVEELVKLGVNINAQDLNGNTALHLAAKNGNKAVVRALIAENADATITNKLNKSARQSAPVLALKLRHILKQAELKAL